MQVQSSSAGLSLHVTRRSLGWETAAREQRLVKRQAQVLARQAGPQDNPHAKIVYAHRNLIVAAAPSWP
jgi:hypothetical protein